MLLNNWLTGVVSMNYASPIFRNVYGDDDEVEDDADEDDDADDDKSGKDDDKGGKDGKEGPKGKSNQPPKGKSVPQEEVDKIVEKRLARERKVSRQALEKLKEAESSYKMTAAERDKLASDIAELEKKVLPADEIRKREARKAAEKYENDLKAAQAAAADWQAKYSDLKINHEIETAAAAAGVKGKALPFVSSYLRPNTKVVPVLDDDDNPTGKFVTQVDFEDQGEDGKPLNVQLTLTEVIGRMRELPDRYGDLFEAPGKGGIGKAGGGKGAGTAKDGFRAGMSMEEYMELRAKNPSAVYGRS